MGIVVGLMLASAIGSTACVVGGRFECSDDARCVDGDRTGVCEATGYCSFADATCDSGARYSRFAAPSLAERCTSIDDIDTGTNAPSTGGDDLDESGSSGVFALDLGPPPVHPPELGECGDGWLAPSEACDDDNTIDGDGCNHDCVVSGTPLWTVVIDGSAGGGDIVNGVAMMPDGDVVATGRSAGDGGDAWMARFDPTDGGQLRTWQYGSTMFDEGTAIATDDASQIYVVGTTTGDPSLGAIFIRVYYDALYDGGEPGGNAELVWSRTVNSNMPADDLGRAVGLRPSVDQVVIAGSLGDAAQPEHPDTQVRAYPSAGGNAIWTSYVGIDPLSDEAAAVVIDDGGRVFVAGSVRTASGNPRTDGWIGELNLGSRDNNVPYAWTARIGDLSLREAVYTLGQLPTGELLLGGHLDDHAFWATWTTEGGELDRHVAADDRPSTVHAIAADASGAVVTVGEHLTVAGDYDVEVTKYAPDGAVLWIDQFDGDAHGNDVGRAVAVAPDGTIVAAGATWAPASDSDFWLRKYAP